MVYVRREEEKQKQKAKIMLSMIKHVNRGRSISVLYQTEG
jgi:hypothetical protein